MDSVLIISLVTGVCVIVGLVLFFTFYKHKLALEKYSEEQRTKREEERTYRKQLELKNERYDMELAYGNSRSDNDTSSGISELFSAENLNMFVQILSSLKGGGSGASSSFRPFSNQDSSGTSETVSASGDNSNIKWV